MALRVQSCLDAYGGHFQHMLWCHITHTTNVLLLKFSCNIFIDVRIIKEMPGSAASGTPCIITFKATWFNCTETSSGLLENRYSVSTFTVLSGIPKAYSMWCSQYKSTRVRDTCTFLLTVPTVVNFWDPRMHYKCWYIVSILQKAWWCLNTVEPCYLKCNYIIKLLYLSGICIFYEWTRYDHKCREVFI